MEHTRKLVGYLNKTFGYNGFKPIEAGTEVYEEDGRYLFIMKPLKGDQEVIQRFYKETLEPCVDRINTSEKTSPEEKIKLLERYMSEYYIPFKCGELEVCKKLKNPISFERWAFYEVTPMDKWTRYYHDKDGWKAKYF